MRRFILTAGAMLATVAVPQLAAAQTEVALERDEDGYGYVFPDDPLDGSASAANAPIIRVAPRGVRRTLIRPRVHFVPELLKSVERL